MIILNVHMMTNHSFTNVQLYHNSIRKTHFGRFNVFFEGREMQWQKQLNLAGSIWEGIWHGTSTIPDQYNISLQGQITQHSKLHVSYVTKYVDPVQCQICRFAQVNVCENCEACEIHYGINRVATFHAVGSKFPDIYFSDNSLIILFSLTNICIF